MKQLIIYFLGWGGSTETIKCNIRSELETIHELTQKKWARVDLCNGSRFINTNNILWFDIFEKEETKE